MKALSSLEVMDNYFELKERLNQSCLGFVENMSLARIPVFSKYVLVIFINALLEFLSQWVRGIPDPYITIPIFFFIFFKSPCPLVTFARIDAAEHIG
jgi:hypothetical protein